MAGKNQGEMDLRITDIRDEAPGIKLFRLEMGAHPPLQFKPGQFVIVRTELWNPVKNRNMRVNRAFSIASSPTERDYIDLAVKRYPGGRMTPWLHDHVHAGDRLRIKGPEGKFFLDPADRGNFFFIAGGVGIAPLRSMIRYLMDIQNPGGIRLFYSARTPRDFAFKKEFDRQAENHPDMRCVYTVTRPGSGPDMQQWSGRTGRFDAEFFGSRLEGNEKGIFLCGPPPMVREGKKILRDLEIPDGIIHSEMW